MSISVHYEEPYDIYGSINTISITKVTISRDLAEELVNLMGRLRNSLGMEAEFELFGSKRVKISILTAKGNLWKIRMLNILPELNRVAS